MHRTIAVLFALIGLFVLPSTPLAQVSPGLRTAVENAIAFLSDTGDPDDLDAAARLRTLLENRRIEVGVASSAADTESLAWTEDGVIHVNQARVGNWLKPVVPTDYSPRSRQIWGLAFDLAETLVHEMKHLEQGNEMVTESNVLNIAGLPNDAELAGWRVGLCSSTRWLDGLASRLPALPPAERAELAFRLADASAAMNSGLNSFIESNYLGRLGAVDFSALGWCKPGGGVFESEAEGRKFLNDYLANMQKIGAEAGAAAAEAAKPKCCLGDGDGPHFCCQWLHPVAKKTTCSPAKNRPLCESLEQGKAVDNADCMDVEPGVAGCKPR